MFVPSAICCKCLTAMHPAKNGVFVEVTTKDGYGNTTPYYKISSDRYKCPKCGIEVLAGFAEEPMAEHWQDNYDSILCDVVAKF